MCCARWCSEGGEGGGGDVMVAVAREFEMVTEPSSTTKLQFGSAQRQLLRPLVPVPVLFCRVHTVGPSGQ